MPTFDDEQHEALHLGERLQWATIAWNLMEVVVTIWLGLRANSLALIAFGLDSVVEVFASLVVIWYIADHDSNRRALRAMRLVAIAFAVLGIYLVAAGISSLVGGSAAEASPWGIAYLALTAIAMFTLAILKRKAARTAGSPPLAAEASMTFLDGCLASGILVALVLSATLELWWADPAAALLVAAFCFRAAIDSWREGQPAPGT